MKQSVGYVQSDNRASGGALREDDILGCNHCQCAMNREAWKKKGGWCSVCDAPVCFSCVEQMRTEGCLPWRKLVDQHLETQAQRRQLEKALGL